MKVIHINSTKIVQDKQIRELAESLADRMKLRTRAWAKRKYAALKKDSIQKP